MPDDKLKKNTGFKLNSDIQTITTASGIPSAADRFKAGIDARLKDIGGTVDSFANTIFDNQSRVYTDIINDPSIGIGGSHENNPVNRMFAKGSDKKYPYLYSRYNPDGADYASLFADSQTNPSSSTKAETDDDYVVKDSKTGEVITYENTNQNTIRQQNFQKNQRIAGLTWQGKTDKKSLQAAEADAKLSSETYDRLVAAMRSGNIANATSAIDLANIQYNPGPARMFQSRGAAFHGERFHGPVGNTWSGQNLQQILSVTGSSSQPGRFMAQQYMPQEYSDAYGSGRNYGANTHIMPQNQVKFHHRRMLGGINTLHNIAKAAQDKKNIKDKSDYKIKRELQNISNRVKNFTFNFDTKSGLTNKTSLANRLKNNFNFDTKSGE
jgi:hypothetical protein